MHCGLKNNVFLCATNTFFKQYEKTVSRILSERIKKLDK
jgi:hypothetical protein